MCRMYSFNVHQSEMAAPRANFIVLLFFSLSPLTQCLLDCFIDNEECEIHEGNLVQTIMGISSMTECAGLCEDERYCTTFTFFEAGSHPLNEACLLFSNCPKRRSCQGCVTGSNQDSCTCSVTSRWETDSAEKEKKDMANHGYHLVRVSGIERNCYIKDA